jgi:hypothetical protein
MTQKDLILQTKSQCSLLRLLINHLCEDIERYPESPCSQASLQTLESTLHMLHTINTSLSRPQPTETP